MWGAGSGAPPPVAAGDPAPEAEGPVEITPDVRVRIVDAGFGAEHSKRQEKMEVPFGVNQNGNELVYVLLERASRAGAAFVGDLDLIMTFRWRGEVVECSMPVRFAGDPRLQRATAAVAAAPPSGYSTDVEGFKPQPVEAVVDDRELVCAPRAVAVTKKRRVQSSARAAERGRVYDGDTSMVETAQELDEKMVCAFETVTRRTTRFDYQLKLGFVPPDWAHFAASYADGQLVAGQPRCYRLAETELGKRPEYRLTAVAYHTGAVKGAAPLRLPSRGMVEAQWSPGGSTSERTCTKILSAAKKSRDGAEAVMGHCNPAEQMRNVRAKQRGLGEPEVADDEE